MAYDPNTLSFSVPETDMVYIDGLPPGISEEDVATHFATIGVLKHDKKKGGPKIWLYRDKGTGALKVRAITCQQPGFFFLDQLPGSICCHPHSWLWLLRCATCY